MKRIWTLVACTALVAPALTGSAEVFNFIEAIVDDAIITAQEVLDLNRMTYEDLRRKYGADPARFKQKLEAMRQENLDKLLQDRLIVHEFKTAGYTLPEFFDHIIALAAADPDLAHILRIHYSLVEELQVATARPGSDRWIALIAEGQLIGGTNTEPTQKAVGGNHRDTLLASTGAGLRLSGKKFYSTGAQFSDYLRVTAQDDDTLSLTGESTAAPVSVSVSVSWP